MQTFLPYPDFNTTVSCLDMKRLGKQRVEAMQIYNIICGNTSKKGWINHPAVRMWRGFENALAEYHNSCIVEWIRRGYKNTMKFLPSANIVYPEWFGNDKFHSAHRQTLLFKFPEWYSKFGWSETPKYEYVWPV